MHDDEHITLAQQPGDTARLLRQRRIHWLMLLGIGAATVLLTIARQIAR